jgi:hypothetical protein
VKYVLAGVVLAAVSLGVLLAGVVWGGPWPPRQAVQDGTAQRANLGTMRSTTASIAVAITAVAWRIPVFDEVWMRYAVFVCAPLLVGVGIRRLLLWREVRGA